MVNVAQELARQMLADYDARTPGQFLGEPLDLTTAQAYALHTEIARLREQRGERVIGYKVGCTSRPIQVQLGVKEPIFGRLFDTECHLSGVINEVVVGAVEDAASLTCPIESLHWLAGRLVQFGVQLYKGQVILTGSPMKLFPVAPGSHIVVEAPPLGASYVEIDV